MKKRLISVVSLLLSLLFLVGCGASSVTEATTDESMTSLLPTEQSGENPKTEEPSEKSGTPDLPTDVTSQTPSGNTSETPIEDYEYRELNAEALSVISPLFSGKGVYTGSVTGLVNVFEKRKAPEGELPVQVLNTSLTMRKDAFAAFEKLQSALNRTYPEFSILFVACTSPDGSGLRCSSSEEAKFDHSLGYTADLWFYYKKAGSSAASMQIGESGAAEQTAFFLSEAAKLGIIESFVNVMPHTADDLRHFRYVGSPHAGYIFENHLTFDGYMKLLSAHGVDDPIVFRDFEGKTYGIYFVKANDDGSALIPIRETASDVKIESNGKDGYIVSYIFEDDPTTEPVTPTETEPTVTEPTEPTEPTSDTPTEPSGLPIVYIDAGHGFASKSGVYDNGAGEKTPYNTLSGGLYEADLDLQIALVVERMLVEKGYTVMMSRRAPSYERLPINDRAERVKNAGADLLVSIHANAAENESACGARIYYNPDYARSAESKKLASATGKEIDRLCPSTLATGLVNGSGLAMLNGTGDIPAILVETCFLTNEDDAKNAVDAAWRERMAEAIVNGILNCR